MHIMLALKQFRWMENEISVDHQTVNARTFILKVYRTERDCDANRRLLNKSFRFVP